MTLFPPMDFSFAIQSFACMLSLICIVLVPIVIRRDPVPVMSIVGTGQLSDTRWPGRATRIGTVCLLASFVILLAECYVLLPT